MEHLVAFSHRWLLPHGRAVPVIASYTGHRMVRPVCHMCCLVPIVPVSPSDHLVAFGLVQLSPHSSCPRLVGNLWLEPLTMNHLATATQTSSAY